MFKNGAYYNGIGPYLKEYFSYRIVKTSIDAGFTCPNRDGSLNVGGCIFCSEAGSGEFTGANSLTSAEKHRHFKSAYSNNAYPQQLLYSTQTFPRITAPITEQIDAQILTMKRKWKNFKCIAYFQNYTNTYAPLETLRDKYEQALAHPDCIGIAIATRPDCITDEILNYLAELNRRTFLWIELGLQTSNNRTADFINRAYPLTIYDNIVKKLLSHKIRVVTHLIFGLPGENKTDMLNSVRHVCQKDIFGIKLQLLHIIKGTKLAEMYLTNTCSLPIRPLEKTEYVSLIADALEIIPENITIHRLTGDAPKNTLIAPMWSTDKKSVLNNINMELKKRGSLQGCRA
ncbi:MAG: TIGR01212 family radical SAM protein [Firmicutes bacterium]|nr:TIGR01212 family radical SAM protein [Bacillota bacterium]